MNVLKSSQLWSLLAICVLAFLIGLPFGYPLLPVVLVLLVFSLVAIGNAAKLHQWLTSKEDAPVPDAGGMWGEIFHELFLHERRSGGDKSRLARLLNRFQDAAEVFPDGMVTLGPGDKIEWANPAACQLLGVTFPDDYNRAVTNLIRDPDFVSYLQDDDYSREITIPSPESPGTLITMQIVPFGLESKLILARDVTHIVNLEEMRSDFVANVSHEMRTPITVICGYLETLANMLDREGLDRETLEKPLNTMYKQARRMDTLVRDLLTLARLETEPVLRDVKLVDVPSMLMSLKEAAEILSGDNKHKITTDIDQNLFVNGKAEELHSLFSNLINNAVRYTPPGGSVHIAWGENSQGQPVFAVRDTGQGIARQHLPRLTERFYRVDADRSRASGGTGLGLAIVKHIIERHHGDLHISSEPGKGSEFSAVFPRVSASHQGDEKAS